MIALACDHTGIELKKEMMKLLDSMGLEWKDFGTDTAISCDYPVYGYRAAKAVASGECDRGILICGTGIGIGIAASKVKGTRVCIAEVMREIQVTRDKVEEIDDVLAQMDEDDARILRLWYIERKSKDEITEAVCYSSTSSLYDLRNKALVRFALLYFGAGAMPSM